MQSCSMLKWHWGKWDKTVPEDQRQKANITQIENQSYV